MRKPAALVELAGSRGRARPGTNQDEVLAALRRAKTPLTAYGILKLVKDAGISAPLSVYRALDRLIERSLVHRIESLNAYVPCTGDHRDPAIFTICCDCGQVEELAGDNVLCHLQEAAARRGFRIDRTMIEIEGRCASCAAG